MGDALVDRDWDVVGVGLSGARAEAPSWHTIDIATPRTAKHPSSRLERAGGFVLSSALAPIEGVLSGTRSPFAAPVAQTRTRLRTEARPLSSLGRQTAAFVQRSARFSGHPQEERDEAAYWRYSPLLAPMRDAALSLRGPALWLANDWQTLPIAATAAAALGGHIAYDSHEFAAEHFAERPEWVRFTKPIIQAVEQRYLPQTSLVTTVSAGIAEALQTRYALASRPKVLRNAPVYVETPFRRTGAHIRVLYHGVLAPERGLEEAIESVVHWREERSLHIRGPASEPSYLEDLKSLAAQKGVGDRVTFLEPVPATALVEEALPYDVGLMALPGVSDHKRFALPNKLFEYLMAGLALCVTDLPEMRRLVEETSAGVVLDGSMPSAKAIATAVNALTPQKLDELRLRALAAARKFHFDVDAEPVLEIYDRLTKSFNP